MYTKVEAKVLIVTNQTWINISFSITIQKKSNTISYVHINKFAYKQQIVNRKQ